MIRLHQYPQAFGLPSLSPFCTKVETYLRMTGTPYQIVWERNPLRGPRGKMPFLVDGSDVISDSHWILDHLESRRPEPLDSWLSTEKQATAFAFRRMLDEDLIRVILYSRWVDPEGWRVLRREFLPYFPIGLRKPLLGWIRSRQLKKARGCSILDFSPDETYRLGDQHLQAIAGLLGNGEFLFGERPCTADATAFAFVSTILRTPLEVPLRRTARSIPSLGLYCSNIERRYFG